MDYDGLAGAYAEHRAVEPELVDALVSRAHVQASSRVLEVGCGTGNYIGAVVAATGCAAFAVDPSRQMLAFAAVRAPAVRLATGTAEALPFADDEFDFVFSVDVIHHVRDRARAFTEAFRVLRPGGRLCIATDDEATLRGRFHRRYFPETLEVELGRYPRKETLRAHATAAGFTDLAEERTASPFCIVDAAPYRDRAFSSLHLIAPEAHGRGLAQLERDLEAGPLEGTSEHFLLWASR